MPGHCDIKNCHILYNLREYVHSIKISSDMVFIYFHDFPTTTIPKHSCLYYYYMHYSRLLKHNSKLYSDNFTYEYNFHCSLL